MAGCSETSTVILVSNQVAGKSVDAVTSWQEITGNLPFVKPHIPRVNPATQKLWAAGVGLYKIKQ
jgi:hypothetical protein